MRIRRLSQRGDTIVEVMLVLAVLSFALGIAYSTANRSLLAARAAHENARAAEILASQIELIRYMEPTSNPLVSATNVFQPVAFCIIPNAPPTVETTLSNCDGTTFDPFVDYRISISYASATDTFVLSARWANVAGEGDDNMTMTYRIHPR